MLLMTPTIFKFEQQNIIRKMWDTLLVLYFLFWTKCSPAIFRQRSFHSLTFLYNPMIISRDLKGKIASVISFARSIYMREQSQKPRRFMIPFINFILFNSNHIVKNKFLFLKIFYVKIHIFLIPLNFNFSFRYIQYYSK